MKNLYSLQHLKVLVLSLALLVCGQAQAQWTSVKDLEAAYTAMVTPTGAILLSDFRTDGNGGIYRSDDGGLTWEKTCSQDHSYSKFLKVGDYIYASGEATAIARSADDGKTWDVIFYTEGVEDALGSQAMYAVCYAMAEHNGKLFVGDFTGGGVIYTEDNGETWKKTDLASLQYTLDDTEEGYYAPGLGNIVPRSAVSLAKGDESDGKSNVATENIYQLVSYNGHLYACGIYFVFRLNESNMTWEVVRDDSNFMAVSSIYQEKLLLGRSVMNDTYNVSFLLTLDKNGNWGEVQRPEGLIDNNIRSLASDDQNIYAGLQLGGIYYTPNGGKNWCNISDGIPTESNPYNNSTYYLSPLSLVPSTDCVYCVIYNVPGASGSGLYKYNRADLPLPSAIRSASAAEGTIEVSAIGRALRISSNDAPAFVQVWDASGKKVAEQTVSGEEHISVSAPGAYLYRIQSGNGLKQGKLLLR